MSDTVPQAEARALKLTAPWRERAFPNNEWVLLVVILFECAVFSVTGNNFLGRGNAFEITRLAVEIGLLALALTPIIITGGIDLSVGSMMGLAAVVFGRAVARRRAADAARPSRSRSRSARWAALLNALDDHAAELPAAHRHARHLLALPRRGRGADARRRELLGLPRRLPVPRAGLRRRPRADAALRARGGRGRLLVVAATHRLRPEPLRHRLFGRGGALRRHPRARAPDARLRAVGAGGEPRGGHLRRASGAGEVGRGDWLRADGDHGRGARRRVDLRRARDGAGDDARAVRHRHPPERAAPERTAGRAGRHPDGRAARRDDPPRPALDARAHTAGAHTNIRGGRGSEKLASGSPERRHPARRAHRRGQQLDARALREGERRDGRSRRYRRAGGGRGATVGRAQISRRDDAEGQGRPVLRQLQDGGGRGGEGAGRRAAVGRADRPRPGEAERGGRGVDHARRGRHRRQRREQGRHLDRAAQGAASAASRSSPGTPTPRRTRATSSSTRRRRRASATR